MARQFVTLALVLFALIGFACAAKPAESPKASADNTADLGTILAPGADDTVGNTDGAATPGTGGDVVVEGPVGEPGAEGATGSAPAESPHSGASAVKFSAVAAVAAVAGFLFF